eukprot:6211947-Pleurochrysis_carterae.AAC.6
MALAPQHRCELLAPQKPIDNTSALGRGHASSSKSKGHSAWPRRGGCSVRAVGAGAAVVWALRSRIAADRPSKRGDLVHVEERVLLRARHDLPCSASSPPSRRDVSLAALLAVCMLSSAAGCTVMLGPTAVGYIGMLRLSAGDGMQM